LRHFPVWKCGNSHIHQLTENFSIITLSSFSFFWYNIVYSNALSPWRLWYGNARTSQAQVASRDVHRDR
jgi:hypothetical protein